MRLQFMVVVIANNSILAADQTCTVTVVDVSEPPMFVITVLEVQQATAFPSSEIGYITAVDQDGVEILLLWLRACILVATFALFVCYLLVSGD